MNTKPVKSTRKEKAQSLVELALTFTLLLILLTGIIDLGAMFYTFTSLRDTTQEGAIYGSAHPTQTGSIQDHVKKSASYPIDATKITDISVTCDGAACVTSNIKSCQGQKINVTVGYNYKLITPIVPALIGLETVTLKASITDTILSSPDTIEALKQLPSPLVCP